MELQRPWGPTLTPLWSIFVKMLYLFHGKTEIQPHPVNVSFVCCWVCLGESQSAGQSHLRNRNSLKT